MPCKVCCSQPPPNPTMFLSTSPKALQCLGLPNQPKNPTMFGSFKLTRKPYSVCSSQSAQNPYNVWGPSNQPKCPTVSVAPNQPPDSQVFVPHNQPQMFQGALAFWRGRTWVLGCCTSLLVVFCHVGFWKQRVGFSRSCPRFSFLHC